MELSPLQWWQKAVFYQVYPRSFADANGDGIGDLPGLIARLDDLKDLGIDAIWLSPHYPSPMIDCGYDIADYTAVAPEYGTLADFKRLLDEMHRRDLRLILDLVLNHTSHEHPWFVESRSSRDNPKRDWYVWKDGVDGGPPNNWNSTFGGPAWEYDPATGQYYYHYFFKEQPDLNWRNPEVKQAMFDAMRFWLDLGVDGFRLDAIGTIYEDPSYADHTSAYSQAELFSLERGEGRPELSESFMVEWKKMFGLQTDLPEIHDLMRALRRVVDEYPDRMLVGETDDLAYCSPDELHMVFNFPLMWSDQLTPQVIRSNQAKRLAELPARAWPCNTLGNHDESRVYSHYGDGRNNDDLARLSLALMLTLKGTPFLYNGEEIGMTNLYLEDISQFRDTLGVFIYNVETGLFGIDPQAALQRAAKMSRDRCRTPYQWKNAPNAGFCPPQVTPWLPVNPNYAAGVNFAEQKDDPASLLPFYKRLLRLRKETPALIGGDYSPLDSGDDVFAFLRRIPGGQTCLVALSFSPLEQSVDLSALGRGRLEILYAGSTHAFPQDELPASLRLAGYEILIAEIK